MSDNEKNNQFRLTCIYCCELKSYKEFNKEHVMPVSFGKFLKSMTLLKTVCRSCNTFFSEELEINLGRDSVHGVMHRSKAGVVNISDIKKHHKKKLSDSYIIHDKYGYLLVDWIDNGNQFQFEVDIATQILVMNSTKGIKANFRINNSLDMRFIENTGLCPRSGYVEIFFSLANALDEYNKTKFLLDIKGFKLDVSRDRLNQFPLGKNEQDLHFRSQIDSNILRAIAKIAFNYFTYQYGKQVAQSECFSEVRNYIRFGYHASYQIIKAINKKIFYSNQVKGLSGIGHVIIFKQNEQNDLIVFISFFNDFLYEIKLCEKYPLLLTEKASFFDIKNKTIFNESGEQKIFHVENFR